MKTILIIVVALVIAYWQFSKPEIAVVTNLQDKLGFSYSHKLSIYSPPIQDEIKLVISAKYEEYEFTPKASFQLQARVLGVENYTMGREAELSSVDLALGWGEMSKESVLNEIDISQRNRFYFWRVEQFPVPRNVIETSSANMHLIPANKATDQAIKRARTGDTIQLKGFLVNILADDGWRWNSSMTRDDKGRGGCEVILVDDFKIL